MPRRLRQAHRYASDNFGNGTKPPVSVDQWPRSAPRRIGSHPQIDRSRYGAFCLQVSPVCIASSTAITGWNVQPPWADTTQPP